MKLFNSIAACKNTFDNEYFNSEVNKRKCYDALCKLETQANINDAFVAFRWMLWSNLKKDVKDRVIANSLPEENKIDGYWDELNDEHINTLLKRVLPLTYLCKMKAYYA